MSVRLSRPTSALLAGLVVLGATGCGELSEEDMLTHQSPIFEFIGYPNGSDDLSGTGYPRREAQAQKSLAACMTDRGWEYHEIDSSDRFEPAADGEPTRGSKEYALRYGLGVSTTTFPQSAVGPDLVGFDDTGDGDSQDNVDRNETYVESLSQIDTDAYFVDLYGSSDGFDVAIVGPDNTNIERDAQDVAASCTDAAFAEVRSISERKDEFWAQFGDRTRELADRIDADSGVKEERQEVATCLSDKGYEGDEAFLREGLYPEVHALNDDVRSADSPNDGPVTLTAAQLKTLADLQERELAMAAAVIECNSGVLYTSLNPVVQNVRIELERQFLEDHAGELAEFEGLVS